MTKAKRKSKRKKKPEQKDALMVQVSLKIGLPRGRKVKVSKQALQGILDRMIAGKPLPKNVQVRGIFWRNPNRRGALGRWRWHRGADLSDAPKPLEDDPREPNWEATIPSLSQFFTIRGIKF